MLAESNLPQGIIVNGMMAFGGVWKEVGMEGDGDLEYGLNHWSVRDGKRVRNKETLGVCVQRSQFNIDDVNLTCARLFCGLPC